MTYRILNNESRKGRNGEDEMFLCVEINDGKEIYRKAEWLTPTEVAAVVADPRAIDGYALAMAERGVIARPGLVADELRAHDLRVDEVKLETAKTLLAIEEAKKP